MTDDERRGKFIGGARNMKKNDGIALVKSEQRWSIFGNRENVVQLLQNICEIVNEQEKIKYNLMVIGYIEKQAKAFPSMTSLADIRTQIGQFVSFHDRFDGLGIKKTYSILHATFDQETGSDEWSRGEITFPLYEVLNISGNEQFNVMAQFEKVIERWQNIIIDNIDNDENVILGNRRTLFSIVGLNSSLQNFLSNNILDGIVSGFKNAEIDNFSDDTNVLEVGIFLPVKTHILIDDVVRGDDEPSQKFCAGYFNYDKNNIINGMNRIYFEFNVLTLAFNVNKKIIDIAEGNIDMGNAISNELLRYI
jgi:hypothetical protein